MKNAKVTTTSIVESLQSLADEVIQNKTLDIEKRATLVYKLTGRQLQAGALNLAYQRSIGRLPENAASFVPLLSGDDESKTVNAKTDK
jgi:hypothetical protein